MNIIKRELRQSGPCLPNTAPGFPDEPRQGLWIDVIWFMGSAKAKVASVISIARGLVGLAPPETA